MYVNYWVVLMPHYYHTIHWTINLIWVLIYVYRRFTSLDRMLHCYGLPAGIDFFCDHQQQNSGRNLPKSPSKELQRAPSVSRKRSSPFSNHMGLSLWWCPHYHLCLCTTFFKIIKKNIGFWMKKWAPPTSTGPTVPSKDVFQRGGLHIFGASSTSSF